MYPYYQLIKRLSNRLSDPIAHLDMPVLRTADIFFSDLQFTLGFLSFVTLSKLSLFRSSAPKQ